MSSSPFASSEDNSSQYFSTDSHSTDSMSGKTPMKARTASSQRGTTDEIQSALKADFEGTVYQDVSVRYFAEIVWGLDSTAIKDIITTGLTLHEDSLTKYKAILGNKARHEPALHQPFRQMSRTLLKDICNLFPPNKYTLTTYLWDGNGTEALRSKVEGSLVTRYRKPDLLDVHIPSLENGMLLNPDEIPQPKAAPKPDWCQVRAAIEFKKSNDSLPVIPEANEAEPGESVSLTVSASEQPTSSRPTKNIPKQKSKTRASKASSIRSVDRAISKDSASPAASLTSDLSASGRKRSSDSNLSSVAPANKKIRLETKTDSLQLSTYALESLFAGNRHYATGMLIDGVKITLWYYDRTAAMRSPSFDFTTPAGIVDLGLTLFALSQCEMKNAGFDPYLHRFVRPAPGQPILEGAVIALERPEVEMTNLCYKFTLPGSTDEPVFAIEKIISRYRGINGRGTLVLVVRKGVIGGTLSDELFILKLSWQYTTRTHEGDIISRLREKIPGWKDYLPDPVFHAKLRAVDMGLPRAQIRELLLKAGRTDEALQLDDRDLHAFVTNRFTNIWQARSVDEFKRIFLDCLECHYHSWKDGDVLHRDISENNLMIFRPSETDRDDGQQAVDPKGKAKTPAPRGILNDFDMASVLGPDRKVQLGADPHHHITGTLPFMARDLLQQIRLFQVDQVLRKKKKSKSEARPATKSTVPRYHLYRYDLESFFYILIWAATHYNLKKGTRQRTPSDSPLAKWESANLDAVLLAKQDLYTPDFMEVLKQTVLEGWEDLWAQWIEPLLFVFWGGFHAAEGATVFAKFKEADFDHETCDGHITFQKFMDAIGETPRGLNPVPRTI